MNFLPFRSIWVHSQLVRARVLFCRSLFPDFIVYRLIIVLYVLLWFTASDYPIGIFDLRRLITPLVSLIYGVWLPHWYLQTVLCMDYWMFTSITTKGAYPLQRIDDTLEPFRFLIFMPDIGNLKEYRVYT